jgi:hypothetical protein
VKYRFALPLSLLAFSVAILGSLQSPRAAGSRGDSQFTFTTDGRGGNPGLPSDSPTAKYKEEARAGQPPPPEQAPPNQSVQELNRPPESTQQAGQAGDPTRGRAARTQLGEEKEPLSQQQGIDELIFQNQSPGQTSNIPGTTATSPNGTSNVYGTKGIPIVPQRDNP